MSCALPPAANFANEITARTKSCPHVVIRYSLPFINRRPLGLEAGTASTRPQFGHFHFMPFVMATIKKMKKITNNRIPKGTNTKLIIPQKGIDSNIPRHPRVAQSYFLAFTLSPHLTQTYVASTFPASLAFLLLLTRLYDTLLLATEVPAIKPLPQTWQFTAFPNSSLSISYSVPQCGQLMSIINLTSFPREYH